MHGKNDLDNKPCPHMRVLVSAWLDGKVTGLAKWYVEWHIKHCERCSASVPFFRGLHLRLEQLAVREPKAGLGEERWEKIEQAWEDVEQKR